MLPRLPCEVACKIYSLLGNYDLIACSETCRALNTLIKRFIMIKRLEPTSGIQFESVLKAAQKGYINGNQVKSIVTSSNFSKCHYSVETISRLFPNLTTFKTGILKFSDADNVPIMRRLVAFKKWQKTLKTLKLTGVPREIRILLRKCQFEQLTNLSICFTGFQSGRHWEDMIIMQLKYVPLVKILRIKGGSMTSTHLELLHGSLPLLEELDSAVHMDMSTVLSSSHRIYHATTLTRLSFSFHEGSGFPIYHPLFVYITKKYTSLRYLELSLDNYNSLRAGRLNPYTREILLTRLITWLPATIETFINKLLCTTKTFIDQLDQAVTSGQLPHLTETLVWTPSFHNTPTLEYHYRKSMFNNLMCLHVELDHIKAFSLPSGYVSNLRELHITSRTGHSQGLPEVFNLDYVFNIHPMLEKFSITDSLVALDVSTGIWTKLNVKELTVNTHSMSKELMIYIKNQMTNLKRLYIQTVQQTMTKIRKFDHFDQDDSDDGYFKHSIYLTNHCLDDLKLSSAFSQLCVNNIICSVKTAMDSKSRYYFYDEKNHKLVRCGTDIASITKEEEANYYYFHIGCKSIQSLQVNAIKFI